MIAVFFVNNSHHKGQKCNSECPYIRTLRLFMLPSLVLELPCVQSDSVQNSAKRLLGNMLESQTHISLFPFHQVINTADWSEGMCIKTLSRLACSHDRCRGNRRVQGLNHSVTRSLAPHQSSNVTI